MISILAIFKNLINIPSLRALAKQPRTGFQLKIGLNCFTTFAKTAFLHGFQKMAKVLMIQVMIIVALLSIVKTNAAYALPEDSKAVVEIRSGYADMNQKTHKGVFMNHVELDQGTTHIRASQAITEGNEKNQLIKATIIGDKKEQAHFWVQIDTNKPELHAYANTIEYYPEKHLIKLQGQAHIVQGTNSFSAPLIVYDTLNKHIISESDRSEGTVIIYHPDEKKTHESIISQSTQKDL